MHESRKWSLVDLSHRVSNGRPPSLLSSLKQAFHAGFRKLFKVFASPPPHHPTLLSPSIHLQKANPWRQHLLICHKTLDVSHPGPDAACVLFEQLHLHSTLRYRRYCHAAIHSFHPENRKNTFRSRLIFVVVVVQRETRYKEFKPWLYEIRVVNRSLLLLESVPEPHIYIYICIYTFYNWSVQKTKRWFYISTSDRVITSHQVLLKAQPWFSMILGFGLMTTLDGSGSARC